MNLLGLEADLYRRLGFTITTVPFEVTSRFRAYINQTQREILSQKGLIALRRSVLTFPVEANNPQVVLPKATARVVSVVDRTNQTYLQPLTLDAMRESDPASATANTTPDSYAVISLAAATMRKPTAPGLSAFSFSSADDTTKKLFLEGTTFGSPWTGSLTMNGITVTSGYFPGPGPAVVDLVTKCYLGLATDGSPTAAAGSITLTDGATASGTLLATIEPGQSSARYTTLRLYPTPGATLTFDAEVELEIADMVRGSDEAFLPEDFSWLLISGALLKEYQRLEKTSLYNNELGTFRNGLADLKSFIARATVPVGPAPGRRGNGNGLWTGGAGGTAPATGGTGDVLGPSGAVPDNLASYNGTTGKIIKDSGVPAALVVRGPTVAIADALAIYSGTTGRLITDSTKTITDVVNDALTSAPGVVTIVNGGGNYLDVILPVPRPFYYVNVQAVSAPITLRSMTTGRPGDVVLVELNWGSGPVLFEHFAASRPAGCSPFVNRVTSGHTPLGVQGSALYVWDTMHGSWVLAQHDQGKAIRVPYSAANYVGSPGTWTVQAGDVLAHDYLLRGNMLSVQVGIGASTTAGSSTSLIVTLPFTPAVGNNAPLSGLCYGASGGAWLSVLVQTLAGGLTFQRLDSTAFPAVTDGLYLSVNGTIGVT